MNPRKQVKKRIAKNGDESDAYSKYWRPRMIWLSKPGAVKAIKRRTHKRERREKHQDINEQL